MLDLSASFGMLHVQSLFAAQGKLSAAREMYDKSLVIKMAKLGEHASVASTLDNLASLCKKEGDLEAALDHHKRVRQPLSLHHFVVRNT